MPNLDLLLIAITVVLLVALFVIRISKRHTDEFRADKVRLIELLNEWRGPSDLLSYSPPRPVQVTGEGKIMLLLLTAVAMGILAMVLFVLLPQAQRQQQRDSLLNQESVPTEGTVIRTWTTSRKGGRDYHVEYRYQVNRSIYHAEAEVSSTVYSRLGTQSHLTLRYSPSQPEVSVLNDEIHRPPWLMYLPLLVVVAVGILPYLILKQRNLLERGKAVGAIVTNVSATRGGKSVSFTFLDSVGNVVAGSSPMKAMEAPVTGDIVTIIYDPEKPRRNVLYPAQFVRLKKSL